MTVVGKSPSHTAVSGARRPSLSGLLAKQDPLVLGERNGRGRQFSTHAKPGAAGKGEHSAGASSQVIGAVGEVRLAAPEPQRLTVEGQHRIGSLLLARPSSPRPVRPAAASHGGRAAALNPNGGSSPGPRQRHAATVAARVDPARAEEHRVLAELVRDVLDLRAGRAPRPGRCRPSRAATASSSAAARARRVPSSRSTAACRAAWLRTRTSCPPGRSA